MDESDAELTPLKLNRQAKTRDASSLLDIKLLQVGAYIFIWIIGVLAGVRLLVDYGSVLKPLVLAALSVSILEWIVQTIELMQWKGWVLLILCVHKVKLLSMLLCLKIRRACSNYCKKEWPARHQQQQLELLSGLKDWRWLWLNWDPIFAGRNFVFRACAVACTLTMVVGVFFGFSALLIANVEDFTHSSRMDSYRHQFENLIASTDSGIRQFPDHFGFVPDAARSQWHTMVDKFSGSFHMNSTFISENQQYIVDKLKDGVGSSSTVLTEVAFYLLYTTMWLFAPLQINTDEVKEKHAGQVYGLRNVWRRPVAPRIDLEAEDQSDFQATSQKSPFVRNFYSTKSDPRHGIHERLHRIMQVYFSLKLFVNALSAVCIWSLLHLLHVDLALLLAMTCFFLSFIPELGFMISAVLPIPIILLMPMSSEQDSRGAILARFVVGMAAIKLIVSNVLESYLMGHNPTLSGAVKDHEFERMKETHPVIILFFVVLAGDIWGPTGMLISVPFISFVRLMLNFWHLQSPVQQEDDTCQA
jgi:predicted PurR-regulated permease PerM